MRLSKTAWNNVIIFAVMGFILLINATDDKLSVGFSDSENSHQQSAIIGVQQTILVLTIEQVITVARAGTDWQANPNNISGQALEQMMLSWKNTEAMALATAPDIDRQLSLEVKIALAGQSQALALSFYATDDQLLVFKPAQQQWYAMPIALYSQLFPQEIFTQ